MYRILVHPHVPFTGWMTLRNSPHLLIFNAKCWEGRVIKEAVLSANLFHSLDEFGNSPTYLSVSYIVLLGCIMMMVWITAKFSLNVLCMCCCTQVLFCHSVCVVFLLYSV